MRACLSFDLSLFRLSSAQEPDCLAAAASLAPQLGVALVGVAVVGVVVVDGALVGGLLFTAVQ